MLMVRLQREQTYTGDVRQREEQGKGSVLEENDGADAAGREGSLSSFDYTACGGGGKQQAESELLRQHPHPQASPQFSNHESQGAICDIAKSVVQRVRKIWKRDFT